MRKLIFLFLIMAVALVGMVSAQGVANEPRVITRDVVMSEYGVDNCAVTPDTVLAMEPLSAVLLAGFLPEYSVEQKMNISANKIKIYDTGQEISNSAKEPSYWLLL